MATNILFEVESTHAVYGSASYDAPNITLSTLVSSTSGANLVTKPFESDYSITIEFTRTQTGSWHDDDFSDGQLIVHLIKDVTPTYGTSSWQYQKLTTSPQYNVELRQSAANKPRILGSTGYTQENTIPADFMTGASNKIVYSFLDGYVKVELYIGGLFIGTHTVASEIAPTDSVKLVFHQHSYGTCTNTLGIVSFYAGQLPEVAGIITDANKNPAGRVVRFYDRSTGTLIGETTSDAVTGLYNILLLTDSEIYRIVLADEPELSNDIIDRMILG